MSDGSAVETVPASKPSPSPSQLWHAHFYEPLVSFLDGMQAAHDLDEFISENIRRLQDVEETFVAEALRAYPDIAEETHRRAAELIHTAIHESMRKSRDADNDEVREEIWQESLGKIRSGLLTLTGEGNFYARYATVWNRTQSRPDKSRVLRSSLLMSIVSDFEVLTSALIRAQIALRPDILNIDDQKYSLQDLQAFNTLDEFKKAVGERMADSMLRGGFDDWMDWFQRRHKVVLPGVTDCPDHLVEIFQRRHLMVHNGGVVNSLYLSKLEKMRNLPEAGHKLSVPKKYLVNSIDTLTVCGVKLAFAVSLKMFSDIDTANAVDAHLSRVTFDLLKAGRYGSVREINEWHLSFVTNDSSRLTAMVNIWTAKKFMAGREAIEVEVEAWNTTSLANRYKLVRLALLDKHEEAVALGEELLVRKEITASDWQGWPVLEGVRAYANASGAAPPSGGEPVLLPERHEHGEEARDSAT